MIKRAFTIIELIFIVILIGIMSAVATSYFRDDKLALATYQVLEHIRYTQHLAISDNKFDPKDNYYINYQNGSDGSQKGKFFRAWWQIRFVDWSSGTPPIIGYSIYSDMDREGNIDSTTHKEAAVSPFDGLRLNAYSGSENSPDVNLASKYFIQSVSFSSSCQAVGFTRITSGKIGSIAFDEKGRPYYGISDTNNYSPYQYKLVSDCNITLTHQDGREAVITVHPETGYAEITRLD